MFGGGGFGGFGANNPTTQPPNQQPSTNLFGAAGNTARGGFGGFGQPAQPQQQPPATGGFGAAAAAAAPPSGGGLFGAAPNPGSTGTGFGGFGQTAQQPASGATGGSLFGAAAAKPAGTGFGGFGAAIQPAAGTGGIGGFGTAAAAAQPQTNAFGAANNAFGAKPAGTSLFGNAGATAPAAGGFGAMGTAAQPVPSTGTMNPVYQPTPLQEKDAAGNNINQVFTTITCMPAYQKASLEELRLQDYLQGRKTGQTGPGVPGATGAQSAGGGFGGFGQTGSALGQPAQPGGTNLFGGAGNTSTTQPGTGLFGQNNPTPAAAGGGGIFGQNTSTPGAAGGGMFGQQNKPPGTSLFGQNNATSQPPAGGGIFGAAAKPAGTGFGGFGGGAAQPAAPGTGFGFGANNNAGSSGTSMFGANTGGAFGQQNNQQQPPPPSTGFGFGQQQQQPQPQTNAFGAANNTGTSLFGQNKPVGMSLFGNPGGTNPGAGTGTGFGGFGANNNTQANKPFGFGAGTGTSQPGQTGTSLFGNPGANQPAQTGTSLFGNNNAAGGLGGNQPGQAGGTGTSLFGGGGGATGTQNTGTGTSLFGQNNQQQQPPAQGGGLFGPKPAAPTGTGLFGQSNQAGQTGTGLFGQNNNQAGQPGTGLFGQNNAAQPKPPAFGAGAGTGTGLFANQGANQQPGQSGGGLFGQNNQQQGGIGGGGLFGSKPAGTGFGQPGGGLGTSTLGGGAPNAGVGGGLFNQGGLGAPQAAGLGQQQQAQSQPPAFTSNPYGTDQLFGGSLSAAELNNRQPVLPFNVAPKSAKKPPLVPNVFSSPRNATTITRLRGSTPGVGSSRRETTPFVGGDASFSRLSGRAPSLFRGLSDEQALSPQAYVRKPSVKRLNLDDTADANSSIFTNGASRSMRAATAQPEPANRSRVFSPALESSAVVAAARRRGPITHADDTFNTNISGDDTFFRRGIRASTAVPRLRGTTAPAPMPPPPPAAGDDSGLEHEGDLPMGYYTQPPLSELRNWAHADLASVPNFVVGRVGYGHVAFDRPVDLTTVPDLNEIAGGLVVIRTKEVVVYPHEDEIGGNNDGVLPGFLPIPTADRGTGLNVPATVSLDGCWSRDKSTRAPIKDPSHPRFKQHVAKLKHRDVEFINFEPETGTWTFKVQHFSRYALDDDDDDGEEEDQAEEDYVPAATTNATSSQSFPKPVAAGARSQAPTRAAAFQDDDDEDEDVMEDEDQDESDEQSQTSQSASPPRASAPPPEHPVSFAQAMHVEPRKMQVMQASFFGDMEEPRPQPVRTPRQASLAPPEAKLLSNQSVFRNGPPSGPSAPAAPMGPAGTVRSHSVREGSAAPGLGTPPPALAPTRANFGTRSTLSTQPRIKFVKTSLDKSVLAGAEGTWTDPVVAFTGSFRPGFGFPNTLVRVGAQKDVDAQAASQVKVVTLPPPKDDLALKMLGVQLEHTQIDFVPDDGVPRALPQNQLRFRDFATLFENGDRRQEAHIWRLGSALFDDMELGLPDNASRSERQAATNLRRKAALSQCLKSAVLLTADADARSHQSQDRIEALIFAHLTSNDVEKATLAAMGSNEYHLATLLAQLPGDASTRSDIQEQLATWRDEGVYSLLGADVRKLYELLSGNVTHAQGSGTTASGDKVSDLLIAETLDWKRAFGLHLWYGTQFEQPLQQAVSDFDRAISSAQAPLPVPPYWADRVAFPSLEAKSLADSDRYPKDTLYRLLKVYSEQDYLLEDAILPTGHSNSSTSYRLSWQLYLLLSRVLSVRDFADREAAPLDEQVMQEDEEVQVVVDSNSAKADRLTLDLANQLEACGHYQWAAFVLLYLELPETRSQALRNLLSRSILTLNAEQEDFIVNTLKVPRSWVALARAFTARSMDDLWGVYQYALEGQDLAQAHAVAVRHLAPEVVGYQDLELLREIFKPFLHDDKADEERVPGWSWGGKVYLNWIEVSLFTDLDSVRLSLRRLDQAKAHELIQTVSSRITELATLIPTVLLPDEEDMSTPGALTRYAAKIHMMSVLGESSRSIFRYTHDPEEGAARADGDSSWSLAASKALDSAATVEQHHPTPGSKALLTSANDYCSLLVGALA